MNKNYNPSHIASNTDINLSNVIKVNIKLNKEKEYTPIYNITKRKKLLKNKMKLYDVKNIYLKQKLSFQNDNEIDKIILIQKWWKKYISKQNIYLKAENIFNLIKKIIYNNIMKVFMLNLYNIKYYFLKWYHLTNYIKIIDKIIICRQKYFINKKLNINKKQNIINMKNKNIACQKKLKKLKKIKQFNKYNTSIPLFSQQKNCNKPTMERGKNSSQNLSNTRKKNKNKLTFNSNMSNIIDNLFNKTNINNNSTWNLNDKSPILSSFSSKIHGVLSNRQNSFGKKNIYDNKNYSSLANNKKYKLNFKTLDLNYLDIFNNSRKIPIPNNKSNKIQSIKNINKELYQINKIKNLNINKNNINKNINKYNDKQFSSNFKKENNKLLKFYNRNKKNKNNNLIKRKNELFINVVGKSTHSISNSNILINTEPNMMNNSSSNTNYTINNYSSNLKITSKKKNKIIKDRYVRIKKFDTCPLNFKNKKFQFYKNYYIKQYFNLWNEILLKDKIISNFIKKSKIIELRKIFYHKIRNELLKILKLIVLKKYFGKYKYIIEKIIILKELTKFKLNKNKNNNSNKSGVNNTNLKRGDIINNININNFINYTNNDINNIIPKSTKSYKILSNSMKINSDSQTYYKSQFQYLNNFNNFDEVNIINTNFNFDINKDNYNNKYNSKDLDKKIKKGPKGILVNQINQLRMILNLLEHHYHKYNKTSLLKCFSKWKKIWINNKIKGYFNNNTFSKNEKKRISEKIINFKKINIQNRNKINPSNKKKYLDENTIKKYEIKNIGVYKYKLKNDFDNNKRFLTINGNKSINSARQTNNLTDYAFENNNTTSYRNNKKIKYIEINKNTCESTILKKNCNSEIVYQKKILNINHTSNLSNLSYLNNFRNKLLSDNKYSYRKVNKIEEREVHFNSLSTNKNNTYNNIQNSYNMFNNEMKNQNNNSNNNNDTVINDESNNKKYIKNENLKTLSKITIDSSIFNENNIYSKDNIIKKDSKKSFYEIKNLFFKNKIKKVDNKKVNQTFCGLLVNLENEFD